MKAGILIGEGLDPYFNLALEEYLLRHVGENEIILYLWQNEKTVVIGRNQNIWSEINLDELRAISGHPTRRHSGGGAVYHDTGNLNFTFITTSAHFDIPRQTEVVLSAVRSLGIDAQKTGRNDLCTLGRKFSGHSYYRNGNRCFHNGTILLDTDPEIMSRVLNVSETKLQSKGVKSVKSRTINLKELIPNISVECVRKVLCEAFCAEYGEASVVSAPDRDDEEFTSILDRLKSEEWIFNKVIPHSGSIKKHFDWGNAEVLWSTGEDGGLLEYQVFTDALGNVPENEIRDLLMDELPHK